MTISRPRGFHRVFGYQASINSYRQGRGIITTRKRSSKPIASYTRISLTRGNAWTRSRSCFPIVSSTAVMDQRVGTNRRFFSVPHAPALEAPRVFGNREPAADQTDTPLLPPLGGSRKGPSRIRETLSTP